MPTNGQIRKMKEAGIKPPIKGKININEQSDVACPVCGCMVFQPAVRIKMVHKFLSPSGKEEPIGHNIYVCMGQMPQLLGDVDNESTPMSCGHIVELSNPSTYTVIRKDNDQDSSPTSMITGQPDPLGRPDNPPDPK